MAKALSIDKAVDGNLKPVKDSDGTLTSLEVSTDTIRVKDLVVAGNLVGSLKSATDLILDSEGDIVLSADGDNITMDDGTTTRFDFALDSSPRLSATGAFSLHGNTTVDIISDGHFTVDSASRIILDSDTGDFVAMNAGTQFSVSDSAYAGMIIGSTHIFGSGTAGQAQSISTTWTTLLWDTDKYALVTFVVPPSNIVKISVHLPYVAAASYAVSLGLATASDATSLDAKYQNIVNDANRPDAFNLNYSWVVEGSDHSWSAGETKTIYIMAYGSGAMNFYTGGTQAGRQGGVIVEATALPATIGDGSEP